MCLTRLIATVVIFACMTGIAPHAFAQDIMELDAIVVEGRIQRPQASYIIQRASLEFGVQAKRRSFVNKIVDSIESDLF